MFSDFTPTYLAPSPVVRLLRVVRKTVREDTHKRKVGEVSNSNRDELVLAAHYFDLRQKFLKKYLEDRDLENLNASVPQRLFRFLKGNQTEHIQAVILGNMALIIAAASSLLIIPHAVLEYFVQGASSFSIIMSVLTAELFFWSPFLSGGKVDPVFELADIEGFDRVAPNAVYMARQEEIPLSVVDEIAVAASVSPGDPVAPPGLTELVLSGHDSLKSIRDQLQMTRYIDVAMTIFSFLAFMFGIGLCFWELATNHPISHGLVGLGGAGLIGLFCFYATGRARSSQIALALFESLVADLTLALNEALTAPDAKKKSLSRAAWRNFRVELNALYLLEQSKKSSKTPHHTS